MEQKATEVDTSIEYLIEQVKKFGVEETGAMFLIVTPDKKVQKVTNAPNATYQLIMLQSALGVLLEGQNRPHPADVAMFQQKIDAMCQGYVAGMTAHGIVPPQKVKKRESKK